VHELESKKNDAIRNEKVLEERIKYMQIDKEKQEKAVAEKYEGQLSEQASRLLALEKKLKQTQEALADKDQTHYKKLHEFEKINALLE